VDERTPSRSAAGHEAVRAVQVGLAGLKSDYREALRLRYIEGLPVAEVAARMDRTERAVHMLCHRGLQCLRAAVGRSSQFLSSK
jgi:RNA polymerase sigma-70 factor (ECF subfamily)